MYSRILSLHPALQKGTSDKMTRLLFADLTAAGWRMYHSPDSEFDMTQIYEAGWNPSATQGEGLRFEKALLLQLYPVIFLSECKKTLYRILMGLKGAERG